MKHNEKNNYNKIAFNRYGLLNLEYEDAIYEVWYVEDIINKEKLLLSQFKKKIKSFREHDIIKFKSEMDILSQSDHPNILKIHSVGEYNHWLYTLSETTENLRLSEYIKTNKQPELISILDIIKGIAKALSFAHSHNIVHGSIEPNKIWIKYESGKITNSKLNGFGLFPFMDLTSYADSGVILKTISYLSPEAVGISNSPINKISDIYSLGVLFYQLCTGVLPFYDDTIEGLVHKHIADSFIPPSEINEHINPDIDTIISGLLQKDQDKRYQNIDTFLQDLENLLKQFKEKAKKSDHLNFKTSFIGRRTEINTIKKNIKEADEAHGKLLLISGESGSGKTRLINECIEQIDNEAVCTLLCKCFPGENKTPYHIISDAFEQFYGYYKQLTENERSIEKERLGTSVDNFGQIIVQVNNNMQNILGETQSLIKLEADIENTRFYEVCTQFLCSLGRTGKPVVLFIDDLQWIDEGSLNILNEVGVRIYKYPLLIVGTYRSEDVGDDHILQEILNNDKNINLIKIESLHYTQLRLLLSEILNLKPGNILDELTGYIMNQSKGNPFFSIQLVKYLYEVGVLSQKYGKWDLNGKNIDLQKIPSNLIDFIVKRITLLSHDEKELLECGAIVGTTFSIRLLLKITHMSEEIIEKIILKALQLQLIEEKKPGTGQFRFYHDKIHDAFYNNAGKRNKKKIHGRIAAVYEKNRTRNESSIFLIAYHYIRSNNEKKALSYALKAGTFAKIKYANEEAIRYFNIAKRNIESSGRKGSINWLEVNALLIDLYLLIGSSDKVIKIVNDVLPYIKSKFTKADYFCKLSTAFYRKGDFKKCEEYGNKGLALLGEYLPTSKKSVFLGLIKEIFIHIVYNFFPFLYTIRKKANTRKNILINQFYLVLNWAYALSDLTKFIRSILRMLHLAEAKMGKSKELALSYTGYAGLCMAIPLFKRALKYHNKALRIREELHYEHGIAQSLLLLGFCYEFLGDYKKGISYLIKANQKFKVMGDMKEYGRSFLGFVESYYLLSDYNKALDNTKMYHKIALKSKDDYALAAAYNNFYKIYKEMGNMKEAEKNLIKGYEISKKNKNNLIYYLSVIDTGEYFLEQEKFPDAYHYLLKADVLNKSRSNIGHYICNLYNITADTYIKHFYFKTHAQKKEKKEDLRKIKHACKIALKKTKPWPAHYGGALRATGIYYSLIHDHFKATQFFIASIKHYEKIDRKYELGKSNYEYGKYLKFFDDDAKANKYLEKAYKIFNEIGANNYIKKSEKSLYALSENTTYLEKFKNKIRLSSIIKVSQKISSILNIQTLLDTIIKEAVLITGATYGGFYILNEKDEELELKVSTSANDNINWNQLSIFRKYIARIVFETEKKIFTRNISKYKGLKELQYLNIENIKSIICLPLKWHMKTIGVFYMESDQSHSVFSDEDVQLLDVFLSQAAISLENAELYKELGEKVEERTSQLHMAMKELEISNKDLQHFVYIVSHDLKEPLRMVSGFLQLLVKRYKGKLDENADDFITFAVDGANRMTLMIEDLLKYSRVGRQGKEIAQVNCEEVLDDTLKNLTILIEERKVKIFRDKMPMIMGYKTSLVQLFQNLIVNAVKFCDAEVPEIYIKSGKNESEWLFEIHDNGIGIADESRDKIFQIFKRIDNDNKYSGTGIGLALCKKIVEQHGGKIWVESIVGKGSTFYFTIIDSSPSP